MSADSHFTGGVVVGGWSVCPLRAPISLSVFGYFSTDWAKRKCLALSRWRSGGIFRAQVDSFRIGPRSCQRRRGAEERLVPILMTALATALALVPLAFSAGMPGSEIQAPMAIVILSGLLTSTALNMLVVPAMYLRYGKGLAGQ